MKNLLTILKVVASSQAIVLLMITFVTLEFPLILTEAFSDMERIFYLIFSILTALAFYMILHSTKIEDED